MTEYVLPMEWNLACEYRIIDYLILDNRMILMSWEGNKLFFLRKWFNFDQKFPNA